LVNRVRVSVPDLFLGSDMLIWVGFFCRIQLYILIAETGDLYITMYSLPSCIWKGNNYDPMTIGIYINRR
jgi:hypothetical protein